MPSFHQQQNRGSRPACVKYNILTNSHWREWRDILPELRNLRNRENAIKVISETLNDCTVLSAGLLKVIDSIRDISGCEAIGIRLYENGDYPYYVYDGFSEEHVRIESSLRPLDGDANLNGSDHPFECVCGSVIEGRCTPPVCNYCTIGGSFYTNDTKCFIEACTEEQRTVLVRGLCMVDGYRSIALIPITVAGATIGLLQLNDHRTDMFSEDLIDYLAMIARQIE